MIGTPVRDPGVEEHKVKKVKQTIGTKRTVKFKIIHSEESDNENLTLKSQLESKDTKIKKEMSERKKEKFYFNKTYENYF